MSFNAFDLDISKVYQSYQKDINIYNCLDNWKSNNYLNLYCYNCGNKSKEKKSIFESTPKVFILERGINFDKKMKK